MASPGVFADLDLPPNRLVIMHKDLIFDKIEALIEAYAEVKKKGSLFEEYPLLDGEDVEQWMERVAPIWAESNKKVEGESQDAYLKRIYKMKADKPKRVKETIKAIAKVFDQAEKITSDDAFDKTSYFDCKNFVLKVFNALDLSVADFE